MNKVIVTIFWAVIVIIVLRVISNKIKTNEYMKYVPSNTGSLLAGTYFTTILFLLLDIFNRYDLLTDEGTAIFGCLLLFNFIISLTLAKFLLAIYYKKTNYSLNKLKERKRIEDIKDRKRVSFLGKLFMLFSIMDVSDKGSNSKLEKEMDYNYLSDYEKDLVRKGDYDPTNFEYPENGEELGEDDYYSDDDSWK